MQTADEELNALVQLCLSNRWVPPRGNTEATYFILGSYPGVDDLKARRLFPEDGRIGIELHNALKAAGIDPDDCWFSTVVKRGIGSKMKPSAEDIAEGHQHLERELELIKPKIIITLGAEPFKRIVNKNSKVSDYLGEIIDSPYGDSKLLANHSPGTIVAQDPTKRPQFQEIFRLALQHCSNTLHYEDFE